MCATLGFGLLLAIVFTNEARFTGGPDGMAVPRLVLFGSSVWGAQSWYWIIAASFLVGAVLPFSLGKLREQGAPAGFALFFHNFSTFLGKPGLYLEDLYVKPQFRGRGIGRALLEHLAGLAVERSCGRLEWAVLDWNEPAMNFYRRLGAVPLDDWTTFRLTGAELARLAEG